MVVPALVAAVAAEVAAVAEARVGHVAEEGLHVTLLGAPVPAPAPAPRSILANGVLQSRRGHLHITQQILYTHHGSPHVTCLHCLMCYLFPHFLLHFSFFFLVFIFVHGLLVFPFSPSHQHQFSANHPPPLSVLFFCLSLLYTLCFVSFGKILLLLSIYYCPLTFLCVSL